MWQTVWKDTNIKILRQCGKNNINTCILDKGASICELLPKSNVKIQKNVQN